MRERESKECSGSFIDVLLVIMNRLLLRIEHVLLVRDEEEWKFGLFYLSTESPGRRDIPSKLLRGKAWRTMYLLGPGIVAHSHLDGVLYHLTSSADQIPLKILSSVILGLLGRTIQFASKHFIHELREASVTSFLCVVGSGGRLVFR